MTMRNEEYLQGILGALGVGEDNGVPDPVWRHEEYLKRIYEAIMDAGGGGADLTSFLAPGFSVSEAYNEGDYVVHSGALYRFTDEKTAGAWNESVAEPVLLADEVKELDGAKTLFTHRISLDLGAAQAGYYTGSEGSAISYTPSEGSKAFHVDLNALIGKTVNVFFETTSTGGRKTALCNASGVISEAYAEDQQTQTGWNFAITEEYHHLYISFDASRASDLAVSYVEVGVLNALTERIEKCEPERIQPKAFPALPYGIVRKGGGYELANSIYDEKGIGNFYQYYVNSATGSDSNNGTSEAAPFKTLKKALTAYASLGKKACINILNDASFFAADLYGELIVNKSLAIVAKNGAKLITGVEVTWTQTGTDDVYSATVSGFTPASVVNMASGNVAQDGVYEALKIAASLSDCQNTDNSFFIDGTTVYLHQSKTSEVSSHVVCVSGYKVRWSHLLASEDNFIYLENLNIIGSYFTAARSSSYPQASYLIEHFAINCTFQHCNNNGADAAGYDNAYFVGCTSAFARRDCFNTHNVVQGHDHSNGVVVTMNCTAREAGYYAGSSQHGNNNLFTGHDGENVLRLNCHGANADGPCFADVNGCRSVYEKCSSVNLAYPGVAAAGSWQFNNAQAASPGFVTLKECVIYDARNNPPICSECDMEVCMVDLTGCNITGKLTCIAE